MKNGDGPVINLRVCDFSQIILQEFESNFHIFRVSIVDS